MSDNKHTGRGFNGKGYYIALILCAAAIGISGYLYYQNTNEKEPQVQTPTQNHQANVINPTEDNVEVISPQPTVQKPTPNTTIPPATQAPAKTPASTV